MATIPQIDHGNQTLEEAAAELYRLVEGCFDHQGLSEAERDARYEALGRSLDAKDAERAKSRS